MSMKIKLLPLINLIIILTIIIYGVVNSEYIGEVLVFTKEVYLIEIALLALTFLTNIVGYLLSCKKGFLILNSIIVSALLISFFTVEKESLLLFNSVLLFIFHIIYIITLFKNHHLIKKLPPYWCSTKTFLMNQMICYIVLFMGINLAIIFYDDLTLMSVAFLSAMGIILLISVGFAIYEKLGLLKIYKVLNKSLDIKAAIAAYERIDRKNLNNQTTSYINIRLSKIYFAFGEYQHSIELFERNKEIDANSARLYYEQKSLLTIRITKDINKGKKILEDALGYGKNIRNRKDKLKFQKAIENDLKMLMIFTQKKLPVILDDVFPSEITFDNLLPLIIKSKYMQTKNNSQSEHDLEEYCEGLYGYLELLRMEE